MVRIDAPLHWYREPKRQPAILSSGVGRRETKSHPMPVQAFFLLILIDKENELP